MMRGLIRRRLGNPNNGLTSLIGSSVNWSRQQFSSKPCEGDESDDEEPFHDPYSAYPRPTKEEKDQLIGIANTVPECAPDSVKRYAKYLAVWYHRAHWLNFEEKVSKMHETIAKALRYHK